MVWEQTPKTWSRNAKHYSAESNSSMVCPNRRISRSSRQQHVLSVPCQHQFTRSGMVLQCALLAHRSRACCRRESSAFTFVGGSNVLLLPAVPRGVLSLGDRLLSALSTGSSSSVGVGEAAVAGHRKWKCSKCMGAPKLMQFGSVSEASFFWCQESRLCTSSSPWEEVPGTLA